MASLLLGGCAGDDGMASASDTTGTSGASPTAGTGGETTTDGDAASYFRYTIDSTLNGTIAVDVPCSFPIVPIPGKPSIYGEYEESSYRLTLAWDESAVTGPGDYELTMANATEIKATLFRPHPSQEGTVRIATVFDVTLTLATVDDDLYEGSFDGWFVATDEDGKGSSVTLRDGSFRCVAP